MDIPTEFLDLVIAVIYSVVHKMTQCETKERITKDIHTRIQQYNAKTELTEKL